MKKILLYTDNHFCSTSSIMRSKGDKYSTRLENQILSINWAENLAVENGCDAVIHLGDFFDKPDLTAEELSALKDIKWADIPHKFLVGNHELASSDRLLNSLNALSKIGEVITEPSMTSGFGYELFYLPYILESERKPLSQYLADVRKVYWQDMWTTQEVKRSIILSHNDIAGIRYGSFVSKAGFTVDEIKQTHALFLNGHLHNKTLVDENILNLGNLTGQNFSEDASQYAHCAYILDLQTLDLQAFENPYAFNFYKLEYSENLPHLKSNAVIAMRAPANKLMEAREIMQQDKNICCFRLTAIPEISTETSIDKIIKVDHIEQFKNYVVEQLGSDELIQSELELLK